MKLLITGGAGFIGSHFTKMVASGQLGLEITEITVLDKLTYAGKLENFSPCEPGKNFKFIQGDISDPKIVAEVIKNKDWVVNFAAESHVDRSIESSQEFLKSNIIGVGVLLEECMNNNVSRFLQISTDEVYGTIKSGSWDEEFKVSPNSPYAASKASADLLVQSFNRTHKLDTVITRCSNNYGSHQDPEKLIPKAITMALSGRKIPIYGDGTNIREWIHVADHCRGIALALLHGNTGEIYNIGSGVELSNLEIAKKILKELELPGSQLEFVTDRKGHDYRYSVDYRKIQTLGYEPRELFDESLATTIKWFKQNYAETQS